MTKIEENLRPAAVEVLIAIGLADAYAVAGTGMVGRPLLHAVTYMMSLHGVVGFLVPGLHLATVTQASDMRAQVAAGRDCLAHMYRR